MQFTEMQELALWKAIADAANERITTRPKGGANLRTEIDDSMVALYETTGADRVKLKLHEQEVGTLSLTFTKPKQGVEMRVTDTKKLVKWLRETDEGGDVLMTVICGIKLQEAIVNAAMDYGFLPDGCAMVEVNEPKHYKGTMLKVDGLKVARAMAGELPSAVAGLLWMGEVE